MCTHIFVHIVCVHMAKYTVYYSYLYRLIYDQVPGIQVADIKIGTSKDSLAAQDITLTNVETAQVTAEKVMIS